MMQIRTMILIGSALAVAGAAMAAPKRAATARPAPTPPPAPKARYAMDASTLTGMSAMQNGGRMSGMSMMFGGGGGKEAHSLRLRLGSTQTATSTPNADHFFLPAAKLGKSVPLVAPERQPIGPPSEFQRPKGRLLLFWGCGAHAAKSQPVIIDFAKIAAGQMPPNLYSTRIPLDRGPTLENSRTYGEWPNKISSKPAQPGSILGEHRIASTYAPEIKFTLAQDFMGPLQGKTTPSIDGATALTWNSLPAATGYYAWVMGVAMGGQRDGPQDMVWWASSASRDFGGGLFEGLSPELVQRLIADKTVMPPSQTSCTVPVEVKQASPDFMVGTLYAYGPESNFVYPPRPETGPWLIDWTARVRFHSTTSWMLGGPPGMQGGGRPKFSPFGF